MNRRTLRGAAIIGAATVSALAISPAFAAAATSQATAQSLNVSIAGNTAISQLITATNDGSGEVKSSNDTLPTIASLLPETNILGVGVAPQDAAANGDGTSYACAGLAGTGGGIVTVGDSACNIDGQPLTLGLGNIDLGNADVLLGDSSALGAALQPLDVLLIPLGLALDDVTTAISDGLAGTPLGELGLTGSLSAVEGTCFADPDAATGDTHLVDSTGGSNATPIALSIPGGDSVTLVNLPANPPPNTHVLVNLDTVTQTIIDALSVELETALQGALDPLRTGLTDPVLQQVQDAAIVPLVAALQPLLQPLQENILDIGLNIQSTGDNGRSIDVTALDLSVLGAIADFTGGFSLIDGQIGHVTCGPNTAASTTPTPPGGGGNPEPPTVVNSGVNGGDNTARNVLLATSALLALAGTAGLASYRRMLLK